MDDANNATHSWRDTASSPTRKATSRESVDDSALDDPAIAALRHRKTSRKQAA
jgi:hypothetical protein